MGGLVLQALTYLLAFATPGIAIIPWLSAIGIAATLTGTLILGAARAGRLSRPAWVAAATLFTVLVVAFIAVTLLPAETADGPLWLGLPRRAAIVLLGVGVLPMPILAWAYASDHRPRQSRSESEE